MKAIGVICALISAISYGFGTILQAKSTSLNAAQVNSPVVSPGNQAKTMALQTVEAMLAPLFIVGTLCDFFGFLANIVSDRLAPLILVQPIMATNLLFATIFGVFILHNTLSGRAVMSILCIIAGLIMLGMSTGQEGHLPGPRYFHWLLFISSSILFALGILLSRLFPNRKYLLAGLVAGLLFGVVAIAVRVCTGIADPAAWTVIIAGCGAFYFFTSAIAQESVTATLATITLGETIIPAVIGLFFLGDTTVAGMESLMWIGLVTALGGIIMLLHSPGVVVA